MQNVDEIVRVLRTHEAALKRLGALHIAVFGSVVRGHHEPTSDIDLAVSFSGSAETEGLAYFGVRERVREYLSLLFEGSVDLSDPQMMRPSVREEFRASKADAF